jgi:hypothetical protein
MSTTTNGAGKQQKTWTTYAIAVLFILVLLLDAYALYRIHIQRLGNALDYYPFWAGGREVVLNQRTPYDPAVMQSIQEAIYGRSALPDENQHGYAYPAYAPLVFLPFLLLPFPLSASIWIASQQFLVIAAVILTIRATGWNVGRWHLLLLCLAAMTFRYTMVTLVLGQTSIWVLLGMALALWATQEKRGVLAGLALVAASIKPQLVILPALALLVSLRVRLRNRALLALGGAMAVLFIGSWLLAGNWIADYWQLLQAYQGYSTTQFPVAALAEIWLPSSASQMINAVVIAALLGLFAIVLWRWRGRGRAAFPVALAIVVSQLVVPQTGSYNLVTLLLPAVVALHHLGTSRRRRTPLALAGRVLVWADLVVVPWLLLPLVQQQGWIAVDHVIVPALLLVALVIDRRSRP